LGQKGRFKELFGKVFRNYGRMTAVEGFFSLTAVFVFIKIDPNLWGHARSGRWVDAEAATECKGTGELCVGDILPRYRMAFLPPRRRPQNR
jgi:hypothetical protein